MSDTSRNDVEMDMTPMIDVSFQLLIFFILTINFPVQEGNFNTKMPKKSGTQTTTKEPPPPLDPLQLTLRYNHRSRTTGVGLNGKKVASWRDGVEVPDEKRKSIGRRAVRLYRMLLEQNPKKLPPVKIDAESNVPSGRSIIILDILKKHVLEHPPFRGKDRKRPPLQWTGNRNQGWGTAVE